MHNKENEKYIIKIIETVKEFNWKINKIWVKDNCIYGEVVKASGKIEIEGLYAGSDFDPQNVYDVFNRLRYILNFNGMLKNNNVMI